MSDDLEKATRDAAIDYNCAFADWVAVDTASAIENFIRLNICILACFWRDSRVKVIKLLTDVYKEMGETEFEDFQDLLAYFEEHYGIRKTDA